MAKLTNYYMLLIIILLIVFGLQARAAVPYDETYIVECLATPLSAQYGGGMVVNANLDHGLEGWTAFGDAKIDHVASQVDGNNYVVASNRNLRTHSISQEFILEKKKNYVFSAWVQSTDGETEVVAVFRMNTSDVITAGRALACTDCWTMMKGGFVAKTTGSAHLYFETYSAGDVLFDSLSLQSFTHQEWKYQQQQSIEKVRKQMLRIQVVDTYGRPIKNANVSLKQKKRRFPFGCAINQNILNNPDYQNWFLSRFKYTVFENELKWYFTENQRGVVDYTIPDRMMKFAKANKIGVRGHNVLWEDKHFQPDWVYGLSPTELWYAAIKRTKSVVHRYRGKLLHWDVMNENLNFDFFESSFNDNRTSAYFYHLARKLDHKAVPFLNDFNTLEESNNASKSSPYMYVKKIEEMRAQGYKGRLGIGLEGHFEYDNVNVPYIRTSLEYLKQLNLPIWITELDITEGPDQAKQLDLLIRELHSHSSVRGIIMWASLGDNGCYRMCLTDRDYNNLPTGEVVDTFISELRHEGKFDSRPATTDSEGFFEASLYYGHYEVEVTHPNGYFDSRMVRVAKRNTMSLIHRFTFDVEN